MTEAIVRNLLLTLVFGLALSITPTASHAQEIGAKEGDRIKVEAGGKEDSVTVKAAPESKYFIWAPRLQSNNWHAGNAITNWKDDFDKPHDEWPGRRGNEIVTIGNAAVVIDKEPVKIDRLTAKGSLIVKKPLTLFGGGVKNAELAAAITIKDSLNLSGQIKWTGRSIAADGSRPTPSLGELVNRRGGKFVLDYGGRGGVKSLRLQKAFWNSGTVDQGAGALALVNGGNKSIWLVNDRRAEYRLAPGASITTAKPKKVRIRNSGTFAKAAAKSNDREVEILPPFDQDRGKLVVGSGKVILKNGGDLSGGALSGNGILDFAGGTTRVKFSMKTAAPLRLALSGGKLVIAKSGSLAVTGKGPGFHMSGGAIRADGPLKFQANWRWTAGDISATGGLASHKTLTIDGAKSRRLTGTFTNKGTVVQGAGATIALQANSSIANLNTYRLNGSLTGAKTSSITNDSELFLGRGAKVTLEGAFSNVGEVDLAPKARMQLKGGLKELVHHSDSLPMGMPRLPGRALALHEGEWTVRDGASVDITGPKGYTSIQAIGELAVVTLAGSGRINNMPQPPDKLEGLYFNFGALILKDNAKWTSGDLEQRGYLFIDKTSSMRIETRPLSGESSFNNTGTMVVDGTLSVTDRTGNKLEDKHILISGTLKGSGRINGKPVSAFGGTVTKPQK